MIREAGVDCQERRNEQRSHFCVDTDEQKKTK